MSQMTLTKHLVAFSDPVFLLRFTTLLIFCSLIGFLVFATCANENDMKHVSKKELVIDTQCKCLDFRQVDISR